MSTRKLLGRLGHTHLVVGSDGHIACGAIDHLHTVHLWTTRDVQAVSCGRCKQTAIFVRLAAVDAAEKVAP